MANMLLPSAHSTVGCKRNRTGQGASLFRGTNFSTMISHPVLIPFFPRFFPVFDAFFSLLQELEGIGDVIIGDVTTVPCAWEGVCAGLPARVEVYICVSCGVCHGMRA